MAKPSIVFQTDFGLGGGGAMYGVCKQVDPDLRFYELTHTIPTFDVVKASISLRDVMPAWPKGTIFVSVVDPGVGTARRASIARTSNGYYITTPDNGSLTYPLLDFGIEEIRRIDETVNRYHGTENTSISGSFSISYTLPLNKGRKTPPPTEKETEQPPTSIFSTPSTQPGDYPIYPEQ